MTEVHRAGSPETATELPAESGARALRSTVVYTAATSLQRAIMFLLLPVFTYVLSPDEYGRLSIALAIYAVAAITFALGLDLAVFRNYVHLSDEPAAQRRFVASVWTWLLIVPLCLAAALAVVAAFTLDDQTFLSPLQMMLTLAGAALYVGATTVPLAVLRAEQRLAPFVLINVVAAISTSGLAVAFVIAADGGVTGWLASVVVANLLTLVVALRAMEYRRPTRIERDEMTAALRFSLPLLPHTLAHWALQLADRLVLAGIVTVASVGIYGLAAGLAMPLMIIVQSLNAGVQPHYAVAGKHSDRLAALPDLIRVQVGLVVILTLTFALLGPPVVNLLIDAEYASAAELVPWIALGFGFLGLYCVPMNAAALIVGRTRGIWVLAVTAAAVNLAVILLFVPDDGLIAAAVASAAGYGVLLLGTYVFSKLSGDPIDYPWAAIGAVIGAGLAAFAAGAELLDAETIGDGALRALWLLAAGGLIVALIGPRRLRRLW